MTISELNDALKGKLPAKRKAKPAAGKLIKLRKRGDKKAISLRVSMGPARYADLFLPVRRGPKG
jgi:hypothetical protein